MYSLSLSLQASAVDFIGQQGQYGLRHINAISCDIVNDVFD
jgi:hypothetical protein